jgi:hypothetical protein
MISREGEGIETFIMVSTFPNYRGETKHFEEKMNWFENYAFQKAYILKSKGKDRINIFLWKWMRVLQGKNEKWRNHSD